MQPAKGINYPLVLGDRFVQDDTARTPSHATFRYDYKPHGCAQTGRGTMESGGHNNQVILSAQTLGDILGC